MTQQILFGGLWTQQKLQILSKYLRAYRTIFERNEKARFFKISYVDAFAGTGVIPRDVPDMFAEFFPELAEAEAEFRKGSATRALEVEPPFDHYVFIEKDPGKCEELLTLSEEFTDRDIRIYNEDANIALQKWCSEINTVNERAVVFLDPFGASVEWNSIKAIAQTRAVDLWILFPYAAINRMLINNRKPPKSWSDRLTQIFGTDEWEKAFYSSTFWQSILDPNQEVEQIHKIADKTQITEFFIQRLRKEFVAVANPGFLYNSKGLLFVLLFAAGNEKGAKAGLKIANDLIQKL
ncbi:MAG: three-Cys-motif partner protein TcmP [Terracidiphilus sp.]